ncbi:MAG: hypothetical protein IJK23_01205 [Clostridia bacterium]|nr:hypothetical protein [Clostridia bacterium]
MKRILSVFISVLVAVLFAVSAFAASPAVKLECGKAAEGEILYVDVVLSGCEGLTSADLKFNFDPGVLSFLGALLQGAAAGDEDLIAVFSEPADANADGCVAMSFIHLDKLSAEEGDGVLCQLAFRTGSGSSTVKAKADSFAFGNENVSPSLGTCRYSAGLGSFFKQYGSIVLICAVSLVVIVVLVVLLIIIRKMKKNIPVPVVPFDDADAAQTEARTVVLTDPEAFPEEPETAEEPETTEITEPAEDDAPYSDTEESNEKEEKDDNDEN